MTGDPPVQCKISRKPIECIIDEGSGERESAILGELSACGGDPLDNDVGGLGYPCPDQNLPHRFVNSRQVRCV